MLDSLEEIYNDIEIARKEIENNPIHLLYPDAFIEMEIYCIPSHNHHAFYLQLCTDAHREFVKYARTEINDVILPNRTIYMYTFADVIKAQNRQRYSGKTICGLFNVDENLHDLFRKIQNALPEDSRTSVNKDRAVIDGVLHWIKYKSSGKPKEYRYFQAENFLTPYEFSPEKAEILDFHNEIIERYFNI